MEGSASSSASTTCGAAGAVGGGCEGESWVVQRAAEAGAGRGWADRAAGGGARRGALHALWPAGPLLHL